MPAIAFTDAQLEQIRMTAAQIPRRMRDAYLRRVGRIVRLWDFGDGDVHRAASHFQLIGNLPTVADYGVVRERAMQ